MRANPLQKIEAVDALDFVMKDGVAYRDDDRRLGTDCPDFWAPGRRVLLTRCFIARPLGQNIARVTFIPDGVFLTGAPGGQFNDVAVGIAKVD